MLQLMIQATFDTLGMVLTASILGMILGFPLSVLLFLTAPQSLRPSLWIHRILGAVINTTRSVPYIILIVALIPITRFLIGTSIGTAAATVPLTLAAIMLLARVGEEALHSLPKGLIETGLSLGATQWQIIWKILLPEALPSLISGTTLIVINLVGFSAMAGAVGGGGLGDLAIRYGYQRYNLNVIIEVICILVAFVYLLQITGNCLLRKVRK
jgi:ABC-type methionine transport system permease subunit